MRLPALICGRGDGAAIFRVCIGKFSHRKARVEGRSSLARQGLIVHFTAPTIHTDFNGTITLEMINLGKMPLILTPGMRICQLIIESVIGVPTPVGLSQFQNQQTPAG